jgi:hypothetical protein
MGLQLFSDVLRDLVSHTIDLLSQHNHSINIYLQ